MDKILAPIKGRILEYLVFKGFEKKSFFEKLNVASSNFRGLSLKSEIGADVVAKISTQYTEVSPEWLLTGNGEMIKGEVASTPVVIVDDMYELQKKYIASLEKIQVLQEENARLQSIINAGTESKRQAG